jgi:beta-1,4-N-acetylglucosaminyltransferase
MIFLTVGTQFPFDRLVKFIDGLISQNGFDEEIFGQIGCGTYKPRSFEYVEYLEKSKLDRLIQQASSIISHAGMGTITIAMECGKPLLVMPRLAKHGEVVNDHQVAIARKFEELGHILVAYETEQIPEKLEQLKTFVPRKREAQPEAVIGRITQFLTEMSTYS